MVALALGLCALPTRAAGAAPMTVRDASKQPDAWFQSVEGRQALDNVLSHQSILGDWPKNQNTAATRFTGDVKSIKGTFDNGATTGELRLLARALAVTNDFRYRTAFLKGLDHILAAQYPNGGWPQYSPPPASSYHRHITFNDDAMRRLLELLRDVASATNYSFVPSPRRDAARLAFDRGNDCILKCQVAVHGVLTVWCAQHDEVTLEPRPARTYELASLSGAESAGLLLLLMSLESPTPGVVRAVDAGAKWFQTNQLSGIRETRVGGDKRIVRDAAAPPLWARFYEIETSRPIFSGRDGVRKYDYAGIEAERRNGYAWYGVWGAEVLQRHAAWRQRWPETPPGPAPPTQSP
jgi:PelA/Pel-15E family pectate lyase